MKKELQEMLEKIRNELLRDAKQGKIKEYKDGYVDGVLDTFNKFTGVLNNHIKE